MVATVGRAATLTRRIATNPEELGDLVTSARMHPRTLRPGAVRAEGIRADLGPVVVELEERSFPMATSGQSLARHIGFVTPLQRRTPGQLNGFALKDGLLHAYGEQAEVNGAIPSQGRFGVVSYDIEALECVARGLGADLWLPARGEFLVLEAADAPRLYGLFDDMARAARIGDRRIGAYASSHIANSLLEIAVRSFERGEPEPGRSRTQLNSVRITRLCQDFASEARYQSVTLADLAGVSGVSERRVRDAFYECYGMSPTAFLRIAALHEVRRRLVTGPTTRNAVSRAAADYGFWHLSRFAGQYRALFGETPSATLGDRLPLRAETA